MKNKKGTHEYIEELLRLAVGQIHYSPDYVEEIKTLSNKSYKEGHAKTYPQCYLKLKFKDGTSKPYFPICSTFGMVDPKIIEFSLKLANKIKENSQNKKICQVGLIETIKKLKVLENKYSQSEPVSFGMAARKGHETRNLNYISQYRDGLAGNKDKL